jgi:hypothetical protein
MIYDLCEFGEDPCGERQGILPGLITNLMAIKNASYITDTGSCRQRLVGGHPLCGARDMKRWAVQLLLDCPGALKGVLQPHCGPVVSFTGFYTHLRALGTWLECNMMFLI